MIVSFQKQVSPGVWEDWAFDPDAFTSSLQGKLISSQTTGVFRIITAHISSEGSTDLRTQTTVFAIEETKAYAAHTLPPDFK